MTKTKEREGLLPKIEMIIVGVFFLGFILLLIPKCSSKSKKNLATAPVSEETSTVTDTALSLSSKLAAAASLDEKSTPLYVTIEGLNLRTEPNVSAEVIAKLPRFEKVYFLNETTDFKKEIDWGNGVVTNEPWVKIRTESGRSGWVYGIGVHFYKRAFDVTAADSTKVTK